MGYTSMNVVRTQVKCILMKKKKKNGLGFKLGCGFNWTISHCDSQLALHTDMFVSFCIEPQQNKKTLLKLKANIRNAFSNWMDETTAIM